MSMTDPITINGATIPWQEAEKVAAEVAARKARAAQSPVVEEGRLYVDPPGMSSSLWRLRRMHGAWQKSEDGGATWKPTFINSFDEWVAMRKLIPYTPEPGVVYRHVETTEAKPFLHGRNLYRITTSERVEAQIAPGGGWINGVLSYDEFTWDIAFGRRIPYRGWREAEEPRFKVGDWVQNIYVPWDKVRQVGSLSVVNCLPRMKDGEVVNPANLRPATPVEIAAATRIVPKVGMIIQHKQTGAVYRYYRATGWMRVDEVGSVGQAYIPYPTTTTYTLLPRYTFEGVQ